LIGEKVDQSYISKVEGPDGSISLERLLAICEVLEYTPFKLLKYAADIARDAEKPLAQLRQIGLKRLRQARVR